MKKMQKAGIVMLSVVVLGGVAPAVAPSVLNLNGGVVYAEENIVNLYYHFKGDDPKNVTKVKVNIAENPNATVGDYYPLSKDGGDLIHITNNKTLMWVYRISADGSYKVDHRGDLLSKYTSLAGEYTQPNAGANNNAGTEVKPNNDGNANAGANNNAGTEVKPNNDGNANAGANNNAGTEVKPNNDGNANAGANNNAGTEVKPNNDGNTNAGANNDTSKAQASNQQAKKGSSTVASASGKVEAKKASNTAAGSGLPMLLAMVGSALALFSTLFKKSAKEE